MFVVGQVGCHVLRCCSQCLIFFPLSVSFSLSQSLQEEEDDEVARGIKGRARATAPTPQQLPPHQEWEAAEHAHPPNLLPFMLLPLLYAVTPPSVFISPITMIRDNRSRRLLTSVMLAFFWLVFKTKKNKPPGPVVVFLRVV